MAPAGLCRLEIGHKIKRERSGEDLERLGGERLGGGFDKILYE